MRLYARHPELRLQRGDASFGVDDAAAIVRDATTAVLEYVVADDAAYLFVLARRNGRMALDHYTLKTGRDSLTARVRRLRDRLATRDLLFAQDARDLYDLLLAPAGRSLAGKTHLVIVPDGPLWETPFQALQDGAGRYVIESAAVTHAPSLAVLSEGIRNPRRRSGPPTLLAMGKANFAPSALGPLPEAERQVSLLGSLYGRRGTTYLGSDATESRFKAEASRHQIIHVASHGLLDEASPFYSHIVLSPGSGILGGRSARGVGAARSKTGCGARDPLGVRNRTRAYRRRRGHGGDDVGAVRGGLTRHIGEPVEGRGEIHDGPDDHVSSRPGFR